MESGETESRISQILKKNGIDPSVHTDMVKLAREQGFVVGNAKLSSGDAGIILVNPGAGEILGHKTQKLIAVNSHLSLPNKRYAIARLLGEYFVRESRALGSKEGILLAKAVRLDDENDDAEMECFASQLLMPAPAFEEKAELLTRENASARSRGRVLSKAYNVPLKSVQTRLEGYERSGGILIPFRPTTEAEYKRTEAGLGSTQVVAARSDEDISDDPNLTDEQLFRDRQITDLLDAYVTHFVDKSKTNRMYRHVLFFGCTAATILLMIACAMAIVYLALKGEKSLSDVASLATAAAALIGAVIGILKIITEYVFPPNDEQYITDIVKAIQSNDLENKKVNLAAASGAPQTEKAGK